MKENELEKRVKCDDKKGLGCATKRDFTMYHRDTLELGGVDLGWLVSMYLLRASSDFYMEDAMPCYRSGSRAIKRSCPSARVLMLCNVMTALSSSNDLKKIPFTFGFLTLLSVSPY